MYIIGLNKYFVSQFLMCLKIWNFKFNLCKWRSYPNCVQCIIFDWNFNDTKSKLKNFNSSDCRAIDIKIRFMITFLPSFNDDRVYIENNRALKVHIFAMKFLFISKIIVSYYTLLFLLLILNMAAMLFGLNLITHFLN